MEFHCSIRQPIHLSLAVGLLVDRAGGLWVGTESGVNRYFEGGCTAWETSAGQFCKVSVRLFL